MIALITELAEPRWSPVPRCVVEHSESFVVEDANGWPLAYVHSKTSPRAVASRTG